MGVFKLKPEGLNADDLELELIDFGLEELGEGTGEQGEAVLVIRCAFSDFGNMQKALEEKGLHPITSEVEWIPGTTTHLSDEQAQEVRMRIPSSVLQSLRFRGLRLHPAWLKRTSCL